MSNPFDKYPALRMFRRFTRANFSAPLKDLSKGEFIMLVTLEETSVPDENGGMSVDVTSLSESLRVSMPAISRMLGTLEKRGYVERTVPRSNRRKTYVSITESGREVLVRSKKTVGVIFDRVCAKMGTEEMDLFIQLWEKLSDIIAIEIDQYMKEQAEVKEE